MQSHNDNYDFHYSGEGNLIVFAVENDDYYSFMLQADARTVDLSGGTSCIETIKFQKCRKMSRIIWPFDCGRIRTLSIYAADQLYKLDLTPLYNLESLSIIDCEALTTVIGLPSQLKTINLHNTGIHQLDLQHVNDINSLNLHSRLDHFKVVAERRNYLQHVTIKVREKCRLQCNLTDCPILHDVYIDADDANVKLNIKNSNSIKELTVNAGDESSIFGLADCKQLKYARHTSGVRLKDLDPALLQQRIRKNCRDYEYNTGDITKRFSDAQLQFQIEATAHNPHYDDKETVIQHINSRREFEQGIGATLSLLSHPMEHVIEISQHDLRKMKKWSTDSRPQFLVESTLTPLYILGSDLSPRPERLIKNAKTTHNSPNPIDECMASSNTILLVTDKDLTRKPFLKQLLFLLRNPQFKLHTVFLAGKLAKFDKYIPGLSRKALPVTLPSRIDKEVLLYQHLAADMAVIHDALGIAAESETAIAAATAFTTAINSFSINLEAPSPKNGKSWPAPDTQDAVDGEASHRVMPELNDAVPIDAAANSKKPALDDSIPIDAEANFKDEPKLESVPPLIPEDVPEQQLLATNKIATQLIPDPTPDQMLLQANKIATQLIPDPTPDQVLLQANKIATQLIPDSINDQVLLEVNKSAKELQSAAPLSPESTHDQVLLEANKQQNESTNQERLLKAARDLAIATQHLVDTANEKQITSSNEFKRAEILIKTVNRELQPSASKSMHKEELFAVAKTLTDGLKALADVCRAEAINTQSQTVEHLAKKDIIKKNE